MNMHARNPAAARPARQAVARATPKRTARAIGKGQPKPTPAFLDPATLPDVYGMRCEGDCLEPEIMDGAVLHFSKTARYDVGDFIGIWFRPEFVKPGAPQVIVKRMFLNMFPGIKFPYKAHPNSNVVPVVAAEMLNPPRQFFYPADAILAVHKCLGPAA